MTIISLSYFVFLLISLLCYYILPKRIQWIILLISSLFFFAFAGTPWTISYLLASIIVTWVASNMIRHLKNTITEENEAKNIKKMKIWLICALVVNIGLLALLKYLNFILGNVSLIYNLFAVNNISLSVNWPAALGISFYTLQIIGYLLDSYWGISEPQQNIGKFALFSCFFPQMVSGPISRYNQLSDQLYCEHKFKFENIMSGLTRISIGLFKKVVLAEGAAVLTSMFIGANASYSGIFAIIGVLTYVLQIYADFSGCMDIVIGSAKMFDIEMVENFKNPFTSRSIQEFWQKWHITLGAWLKDYIMYPILRTKTWNKMSKSIKSKWGKKAAKLIPTHIAMLILWFFMGLWHGGGWNFILEGVWFWLVIVVGEWCSPITKKITSKIDSENYFWILFQRVRTLAIYAIGALMFKSSTVGIFFSEFFRIMSTAWTYAVIGCFLLLCLLGYTIEYILKKHNNSSSLAKLICSLLCVIPFILFIYKVSITLTINEFGHIIIVLFSFAIFCLLSYFDINNNGLQNRIKTRPIIYRFLIICIFIYLTVLFGYFGEGYNPADFIYGGF